MSDADVAIWLTYFSVGIFLLVILILGHRSLQKVAARKALAKRTTQRVLHGTPKAKPKIDPWRDNFYQ